MYTLEPDDKTTMVMIYTHNALYRGEVITKEAVRVSIWLRTEGAPKYIHMIKPLIIPFGGSTIKPIKFSEVYLPTADVVAFHIVPPQSEPMDYEEGEANRKMEAVSVVIGTFVVNGVLRISTQTGLGVSLEVSRIAWLSVYDGDVTNPFLPNLAMRVPMMLVDPNKVSFALA